MPFEQKDMGGALFKNAHKQGKQPDYKGDCVVGGHKYQIGAWLKEGRTGKYLALIFSEPWVPREARSDDAPRSDAEDRADWPSNDPDDDVPF